MRGRLNSFQKTMLQWNELHPYNAVHVVRIPGKLDAERLHRILKATLEQRGLTHLSLDPANAAFAYLGGPAACDVKILSGEPDPAPALQAEIERQINTPFAPGERINPFRCFAVTTGDSFFLGLAYFHPVADAESIVVLLRELVRAYQNKLMAESAAGLDLYPDHRAHLLRRHAAVIVNKLRALPAQARNLKQSHRPRYREAQAMGNGFRLFALKPDLLRRLIAGAKSWDVTVNDLLLALLMKSVAPLSAGRVKAARRRKLSVGCIVNLRRELGRDSVRIFGLFLGSFTVTHAVPDGLALRELAGDLHCQTLAIKQRQLYLATPMELALGRFVLRFFSPERRKKFYQKNYPLWGGLTNMNLNALWKPTEDDAPMDYVRGVSTGPVTPLVFSVTTVGDRANVGLSYRSTVFSPGEIEQVKAGFIQHLEDLPAIA
jgi:hypothetical protein